MTVFPPDLLPRRSKPIPYVEARHWLRDVKRTVVRGVVLHCTDTPEMGDRAERCARYFATIPADAPKHKRASAHFAVDEDSIVQCVPEDRIAYGAKGANRFRIHIEHAGLARQTREQWLDAAGISMLDRSAQLLAEIAERWQFPIVWVDAEALKHSAAGVTTHRECTIAFGGSHHDPGLFFPLEDYLARARQYEERARELVS
jgi:N-acetyl-anhydromuramyl-L-alanine amidase AmpD